MSYPQDARSRQMEISVTNDIATTEAIPFEFARGGTVFVPNGSSLTTLTWHAAEKLGGTYEAAYNNAGTPAAVTQTVAQDRAHPIPVETADGPTSLAGAGALKIVGNAAGTVLVNLKS